MTPQESKSLPITRAHAVEGLKVVLKKLELAMRALALRDLVRAESFLNEALFLSFTINHETSGSMALDIMHQLNLVADAIKKAANAVGDGQTSGAPVLEASVAVVDAVAVISGDMPQKEIRDTRSLIVGIFFSLPEYAIAS